MQRMLIRGGYRSRDWVQYHCPFAAHTHRSGTDNSASFGVKINERATSHYYCFTCKKAGKFHALPIALNQFEPVDNYRQVMTDIIAAETAQGFGMFEMRAEEEVLPEPLAKIYEGLYDPAWQYEAARDYLEYRGITEKASESLGLGFDDKDQRVTFPVYGLQGELYGYTGRSILPPELFAQGYDKSKDYLGLPKKHLLLNCQNHTQGDAVVLVEGPMDVARCVSHDCPGKVPMGLLGSQTSRSKTELLIHIGKPVYLMLDDDEAGDVGLYGKQNAEGEYDNTGLIGQLEKELQLYTPEYPDPDAELDPGKLSKEDYETMLANAKSENGLCPLPITPF